jgi:hypothetical protein
MSSSLLRHLAARESRATRLDLRRDADPSGAS